MKILHTADWHLGHRLYERDRSAEHRGFLDWLLETIREQEVELLVVAGDVFDSMNPSNAARNLYFDFLARLRDTGCHSVVIVGGNHDSPSLLDAPAELMAHFRIYVIGGARPERAEQVIPIVRPGKERPDLLVAAVPFLRDRDLRYSVIGETASNRIGRMQEAIRQHYEELGEAAGARQQREAGQSDRRIPVLATGHLFAAGCEDADDKQSHIYLADTNNIQAGQFPAVFDYVALGHIHRAQSVGGSDRVRYSGSPVPLTFGEARQPQSVCLLELTEGGGDFSVNRLRVPRRRELIALRGPVGEVTQALRELTARQRTAPERELSPWVEVRVVTPHPLPLLREQLRTFIAPTGEEIAAGNHCLPELLGVRTERPAGEGATGEAVTDTRQLSDWDPEEVFHRLCHGEGGGERDDYPGLLNDFRELRSWMEEQAADS